MTFVHAALIVDSDAAVLARLIPMLRRSLSDRTPVLMVVGPHIENLVRGELGGALSDRLEWGETGGFYQRLGFAYETFRRYLAEQDAQGRRVHVVAEPDITAGADPDGPVDRAAAYLTYESICNDVYARYDSSVTCLWDSRRHPTITVENVRRVHPYEITATGDVVRTDYQPAAAYLAGRNDVPLTTSPTATDLDLTLVEARDVDPVRAAVRDWTIGEAFAEAAADDVTIAVGELITNGLRHGAAPVRVRGWRVGEILIVQVDDAGGRPLPPDAGYVPPETRPTAGYGLWLARQLADVLTTYTSDGVTSVRLYFPHDLTHRCPSGTT